MNPRKCFYTDPQEFDEGCGYVPCMAAEGQGRLGSMRGNGRGAIPYYWGMTLEAMHENVKNANIRMGHSHEDVKEIMTSAGLSEYLPS